MSKVTAVQHERTPYMVAAGCMVTAQHPGANHARSAELNA